MNYAPKLILTYSTEITDPVPAQTFQEDGAAATISLSGRGSRTVEHISGIGTLNNAFPFFGVTYDQVRLQLMYNRSQVGAEGVIRGISLNRIALTEIGNFSNFQIRMAHTTLTTLTTTYDRN